MNIILGISGGTVAALAKLLSYLFDNGYWVVAVIIIVAVIIYYVKEESNKIGFVSPERRYEAPTVARPPQM